MSKEQARHYKRLLIESDTLPEDQLQARYLKKSKILIVIHGNHLNEQLSFGPVFLLVFQLSTI